MAPGGASTGAGAGAGRAGGRRPPALPTAAPTLTLPRPCPARLVAGLWGLRVTVVRDAVPTSFVRVMRHDTRKDQDSSVHTICFQTRVIGCS